MKSFAEYINENVFNISQTTDSAVDVLAAVKAIANVNKSDAQDLVDALGYLCVHVKNTRGATSANTAEINAFMDIFKTVYDGSKFWYDTYEESDDYGEIVEIDNYSRKAIDDVFNQMRKVPDLFGRGSRNIMEWGFFISDEAHYSGRPTGKTRRYYDSLMQAYVKYCECLGVKAYV